MQSVSAEWIAAQRQNIVPPSFVEVTYRVTDPDLDNAATASDNGHISFGDVTQILDDTAIFDRYITLERNQWVLDGTYNFSTAATVAGFASSVLSNASANFATMPVVTISFPQEVTSVLPGLVIIWSEAFQQYATEFTITTKLSGATVDTLTFSDNRDITSEITHDLTGFDAIEIAVTKWSHPNCRARIENVTLGSMVVFDGAEIMGFEHFEESDLMSLELPHAGVVFSISNVNGEWNPDNPSGNVKYLAERQKIIVRYGYKIGSGIEWIKCGTFFLSEWNTPQNGITAQFTARDALEFAFVPFTIAQGTTITLYDLANDAFTQSGAEVTWSIDNSLSNISVTIPADFDYNCAEVIQLCANAACCVMYQDRAGMFRVEPLANVLTNYPIDEFVSYQSAEYDMQKQLKAVDVNNGMGTFAGSAIGEVQTISNPLVQNAAVANSVAAWIGGILANRRVLSGEYRADPRMDALDKVTVENKYATQTAFITSVHYDYNGAFTGKYEGRVIT